MCSSGTNDSRWASKPAGGCDAGKFVLFADLAFTFPVQTASQFLKQCKWLQTVTGWEVANKCRRIDMSRGGRQQRRAGSSCRFAAAA